MENEVGSGNRKHEEAADDDAELVRQEQRRELQEWLDSAFASRRCGCHASYASRLRGVIEDGADGPFDIFDLPEALLSVEEEMVVNRLKAATGAVVDLLRMPTPDDIVCLWYPTEELVGVAKAAVEVLVALLAWCAEFDAGPLADRHACALPAHPGVPDALRWQLELFALRRPPEASEAVLRACRRPAVWAPSVSPEQPHRDEVLESAETPKTTR